MREVTQSVLGPVVDGVFGDCMAAAVASLLDKPLGAVPNFMLFSPWYDAMELWARGQGLTVRTESVDGPPDGPCVVAGPSPRHDGFGHACVCVGGEIVWDPHPSRAGLLSVDLAFYFDRDPE